MAFGYEGKCEKTCSDSRVQVEQIKKDRDSHRTWFMNECDRLANDVMTVDEIITIFQQELSGIDQIIRDQVDDYFEDDRFD